MLAGFLALAILVMRLFPETSLGRSLHFYLVELPLRLARRIERHHLILLVLLLGAGQMFALAGSAELALAYAADLSIYYDALLTATFVSAAAFLKSAWSVGTAALGRLVRRSKMARPRSRRTRAESPRRGTPANDDDPVWACRLQAA
jgi:hypothetical protein